MVPLSDARPFLLRHLRFELILGGSCQGARRSLQVLQGYLDPVGSHLFGVKLHEGVGCRLVFRPLPSRVPRSMSRRWAGPGLTPSVQAGPGSGWRSRRAAARI
jgi:hypothetical protein